AKVASNESVRVLVDRALAVRPDFTVTESNAKSVAELCARLEGVPLALELAAARMQLLSPAQVLDQVSQSLDFKGRPRHGDTRHHTMRSAIQWTHGLLAKPLAQALADLSVFPGSFDYEAAEAVLADGLALDRLAELCDFSLVSVRAGDGGNRYRLLDPIRK